MQEFKRSLIVLALSALTCTTTSNVFAQTDIQHLPGDVAGLDMVPFQATVQMNFSGGQIRGRQEFTTLPAVADYTIETVTLHMIVPESRATFVALITNLETDPRTELRHYLSLLPDGKWHNPITQATSDHKTGTHSVRLHSAVRPSVEIETPNSSGTGSMTLYVTIAGYLSATSAGW